MKLKAHDGGFTLMVDVTCTAGILDYSKSQPIDQIGDAGDIPNGFFTLAAKKLTAEIEGVYEKCRAAGCDLFGVRERLMKYGKRRFQDRQHTALADTHAQVSVRFKNVR